MTEQEKIEILSDVLDLDVGDLKADMVLDEMDEWDSMTKLSLVAVFGSKFHKTLKGDEIKTFKTIKDILDYME